jgi:uncharacterized repeat protein (TIGR04052 family)
MRHRPFVQFSVFSWLCVAAVAPVVGGGCGQGLQPVTVGFRGAVGDRDFACGQTYSGLGSSAAQVQPADFRLYVHNVRLVDAAGAEQPLTLDQDGLWQYQNVALLDFENKQGLCDGTAATNLTVRGQVAAGASGFTGVRFTLGLPPELNHGNQATAPAPLNLSGLFWSWQDGYKFLRTEGRVVGGSSGFLMHLGSTDCQAGAGGQTECKNLNTPEIRLAGFDPQQNRIGVDLAALLAGSDLGPGMSCQSEPDVAVCGPVFQRLGLPFSGLSASPQSFFRVE